MVRVNESDCLKDEIMYVSIGVGIGIGIGGHCALVRWTATAMCRGGKCENNQRCRYSLKRKVLLSTTRWALQLGAGNNHWLAAWLNFCFHEIHFSFCICSEPRIKNSVFFSIFAFRLDHDFLDQRTALTRPSPIRALTNESVSPPAVRVARSLVRLMIESMEEVFFE